MPCAVVSAYCFNIIPVMPAVWTWYGIILHVYTQMDSVNLSVHAYNAHIIIKK